MRYLPSFRKSPANTRFDFPLLYLRQYFVVFSTYKYQMETPGKLANVASMVYKESIDKIYTKL